MMPNMNNGNTLLTHDLVAKEAAKMLITKSKFIPHINRKRQREFNRDVQGYKVGDKVTVKIPPRPQVTEGHVFSDDDAKLNAQEQERIIKVDTQKHVSVQFGAAEKALDLRKFKTDILAPQVQALAMAVDTDLLKKAIISTNNHTLYGASESHPLAPFGRVKGMLNRAIAPTDRWGLIDSESQNKIIDTAGTLFNPNAEIAKQYKEGYIGRARGINFKECEHIHRFQNGKTTGITVSGANQTGDTLTVGGLANGVQIKAGQVFTIQGVDMLHPTSHQSYGKLLQFVVLEDVTAGGATATLKIYPEITPKMVGTAKQANPTVTDSPANAAPLVFVGGENKVIEQSLIFTPDAFSAAFVPLKVLAGKEGKTFNAETMALRVMTGGDFRNDSEATRIDVLYGFDMIRGNHAARVGWEL